MARGRIDLRVVPGERLAEVVADHLADAVAAAIAAKGRATLALSGGGTPVPAFELLGRDRRVDWSVVDVVQVDERVAPDGDPDRNLIAIRRALVESGSLPEDRLHPMDVTADDLDRAARDYGVLLAELTGPGGGIDVAQLGIGADGHTASLVPGDPVLAVDDRPVALSGPYEGHLRMTLTAPVLSAVQQVVWMVAGSDPRDALGALLAGEASVPATLVRAPEQVCWCDEAADPTGSGARG
jgi:6-phosphogluconolactonase